MSTFLVVVEDARPIPDLGEFATTEGLSLTFLSNLPVGHYVELDALENLVADCPYEAPFVVEAHRRGRRRRQLLLRAHTPIDRLAIRVSRPAKPKGGAGWPVHEPDPQSLEGRAKTMSRNDKPTTKGKGKMRAAKKISKVNS